MILSQFYIISFYKKVVLVWGDVLESFLIQPNIVRKMTIGTDNGYTATECISEELINKFGEKVKLEIVKKFRSFLVLNGSIY